jgi:hypothetical protein
MWEILLYNRVLMERLSKIIINFSQYNMLENFCPYLLSDRLVIAEIPVSTGICPFCISPKSMSESDKTSSRPGLVAIESNVLRTAKKETDTVLFV